MRRIRLVSHTARLLVAVICLATGVPSPAVAKTDAQFHYIDPKQIDLTVLLPPPPDMGSAQQRSDQQQVANIVAERSPAQVQNAEEESKRNVFFFAPSVGAGFAAERLPVTQAFFHRVGSDVEKLVDLAKDHWERPRPEGAKKKRGSYPSGHAAFAASTAIILSEMLPEKRDAIFDQARHFAEYRIILGVHYPTDIASGWTAGTLAAFSMMHDPAFQRDFAAAKSELQQALASSQGSH